MKHLVAIVMIAAMTLSFTSQSNNDCDKIPVMFENSCDETVYLSYWECGAEKPFKLSLEADKPIKGVYVKKGSAIKLVTADGEELKTLVEEVGDHNKGQKYKVCQ